MSFEWIDSIANNTNKVWYIKAQNSLRNGLIESAGLKIDLDDHEFHMLDPQVTYETEQCGLPLGYKTSQRKILALDKDHGGIVFYEEYQGESSWLMFESCQSGALLGQQLLPQKGTARCTIRLEESGLYVDIYVGETLFNSTYMAYSNDGMRQASADTLASVLVKAA